MGTPPAPGLPVAHNTKKTTEVVHCANAAMAERIRQPDDKDEFWVRQFHLKLRPTTAEADAGSAYSDIVFIVMQVRFNQTIHVEALIHFTPQIGGQSCYDWVVDSPAPPGGKNHVQLWDIVHVFRMPCSKREAGCDGI